MDFKKLSGDKKEDEDISSLIANKKMDDLRSNTQELNSSEGTKSFRFTKKKLFEAYVNKTDVWYTGFENGTTGQLKHYSSLVDIYAVSELYNIPIELYICELLFVDKNNDENTSSIEDSKKTKVPTEKNLVVDVYEGSFKSKRNTVSQDEFYLNKLEFVTLINGQINKPVLRIALNNINKYGLLLDIDDTQTHEISKFIKNSDIFKNEIESKASNLMGQVSNLSQVFIFFKNTDVKHIFRFC